MDVLTFGINVTLGGCSDHTAGIVDDELHDYFTGLMNDAGAMVGGLKFDERGPGRFFRRACRPCPVSRPADPLPNYVALDATVAPDGFAAGAAASAAISKDRSRAW
jgi:hypothetical protein